MGNEAAAAIGQLLARSAILSDGAQADAADALLDRAVQFVGGLSDEDTCSLFGFITGWLEGYAASGADQLAPIIRQLRESAGENEPASMRSAIQIALPALA